MVHTRLIDSLTQNTHILRPTATQVMEASLLNHSISFFEVVGSDPSLPFTSCLHTISCKVGMENIHAIGLPQSYLTAPPHSPTTARLEQQLHVHLLHDRPLQRRDGRRGPGLAVQEEGGAHRAAGPLCQGRLRVKQADSSSSDAWTVRSQDAVVV